MCDAMAFCAHCSPFFFLFGGLDKGLNEKVLAWLHCLLLLPALFPPVQQIDSKGLDILCPTFAACTALLLQNKHAVKDAMVGQGLLLIPT